MHRSMRTEKKEKGGLDQLGFEKRMEETIL